MVPLDFFDMSSKIDCSCTAFNLYAKSSTVLVNRFKMRSSF